MSELWHLQCRSERYEVPGDAAALPFLTFALQHENIINCCRICFAWLYSTLLPEPRAAKLNCAGAHSGNFTPPRISPSCPHCLSLWLGRGTIVGGRGRCETGCQACFWMDGNRWAPCLAVFYAGNLHRWSWRILRIAFPVLRGLSADVIQSPDMTALPRCFSRNRRGKRMFSPLTFYC